jgi:predicted Rossmann fold flavoprotein
LKNYKKAEQFLYSAFTQYGVEDSLKYFNDRDMPTKVEEYGRVFPVSDSARSVYNVLLNDIKKNKNLEIVSNTPVTDILFEHGKIIGVKTDKETYKARKYILATGGTSHPETGSTGDAYVWLRAMGHTVHTPKPSLVPLKSKDVWIKTLQGIALQQIKISVYADDTKMDSKKGKILFTHYGVSGPTILNMSKGISDLLGQKKKVFLGLDVLPQYDHGALNKTLTDLFQNNPKKKIVNILGELINKNLIAVILKNSRIDESLVGTNVTKDMRITLIENIKNIKIHIHGLLDESEAVIADGGVDIREIDFKTMRSKVVNNLCIVGDLLNIDRPSGGYSLQLCWTTGFIAARG